MDDELLIAAAGTIILISALIIQRKDKRNRVNPYLKHRSTKGRYAIDVSLPDYIFIRLDFRRFLFFFICSSAICANTTNHSRRTFI